MKVLDYFKNKTILIDENKKIRKGKFGVEKQISQILIDLNEVTRKYTSLLEQKSDQFDLYVKYQNQCVELANDKRDLKKQLAESNEMCNQLTQINEKLTNKNTKLEKDLEKCKKKIIS